MTHYADLVGLPFLLGGRGPGGVDCLAVALLVYRRRGIELPDPQRSGLEAFRKYFWMVGPPLEELDLVRVRQHGKDRLLVVVDGSGAALGASEERGVFERKLSPGLLERIRRRVDAVEIWRLRASPYKAAGFPIRPY